MKMLYTKSSWGCQGLTDYLAPVCKFQIDGEKLVFAAPIACLSANLRARGTGTPPTLASFCEEMLTMDMKTFQQSGGICYLMSPGGFLWLPDCMLVAEFNLFDSPHIGKSLSWVGMTSYHCGKDSVNHSIQSLGTLLSTCCTPSQKNIESHFQAGCRVRE